MDKDGYVVLVVEEQNGLYFVEAYQTIESNVSISLDQAHKRFGHTSNERLQHLPSAAIGIAIDKKKESFAAAALRAKRGDNIYRTTTFLAHESIRNGFIRLEGPLPGSKQKRATDIT